jgi:hypothetical protein
MKMPEKLKSEWIKALRSGEYGQCQGTMCDGNGNFCCLGVLEHVAMGGEVEVGKLVTSPYKYLPFAQFYEYAGIEKDTAVSELITMNDTKLLPFDKIADWIQTNVKAY